MVRWGILGCGGIARRMAAVIPEARDAQLVAAAARDKERAAAFAARFGADKAYGSYEELAADKEVDAVYVATIHPAHAAAVELCLRAGKAVLCEKPLTMSAREARRLFDLAKACGVPLLEAMWTRYLPAWRRARELVQEGAIGELRSMQADFCFNSPYDPASRLYAPELGGGALWDVGIYGCHALIHMLGREYRSLRAEGRLAPGGVDSFAALTLRFPGDVLAMMTCGGDQMGDQAARLYGTSGWIELPRMYDAREVRLFTEGGLVRTEEFPHRDGFIYEVEAFGRLLAGGTDAVVEAPPEDTCAALGMIEEALTQLRGSCG